jgi:hypothetical protein
VQDLEYGGLAAVQRCRDLSAATVQLKSLTQLEQLIIWVADWEEDFRTKYFDAGPQTFFTNELLSSLTALTRLESNLFSVESLAAVSSCVGLQHLGICLSEDITQMASAEWAFLAQLSGLKSLRLMNATV